MRERKMPISFEGLPPYEKLYARSAKAEALREGVVSTLDIEVEGLSTDTVPVEVLLEPEVTRALATQIDPVAKTVDRWRANQRFPE
jgi:hypothetical protein